MTSSSAFLRKARRAQTTLALIALLNVAGCGDETTNPGAGGGGAGGGQGGAGGQGGMATCETDAEPSAEVVVTDRGAVRGQPDGAVMSFLGLPYAEPPLGERRFQPPETATCYDGLIEATAFGPACAQRTAAGAVRGEEDCLTLNVWTPAADDAARPVMVFIHGGGNIQGSSSELLLDVTPLYTGRHLAEQRDVVVVTLNYRLGPFGFLPLPELVAEGDDGRAGNLGILDQIEALRWVQRNAAAFGGDPAEVMVFGESAGGVNTCALFASPLAAGLFHRAAVHSGSCVQPDRAAVIDAFSARVDEGSCAGSDRLSCLRNLDVATILQELGGSIGAFDAGFGNDAASSYGPLVDGVVLEQSPVDAMVEGNHNAVPFVIGSNAEEMAGLLGATVTSDADYQAAIDDAFGIFGQTWVDQILATYPTSAYASPQDALNAVFGDLRFTCPTLLYAQSADEGQTEPVYRYWFSRRPVTAMGPVPASHGLELLFVFGSLRDIPGFTPTQADLDLSDAMIGYWARFAATGDPNGSGAPPWPGYDATDAHIVLDDPIGQGTQLKIDECTMWADFYATFAN